MKNKFWGANVVILLHLIKKEKELSPCFSYNPHSKELKIKMIYLHIAVPEEEESLHIPSFWMHTKKVDNCSFLMRHAVSYLLK